MHKHIKLLPIIIVFFLYSCKSDYAFQAFSYPPESKPHENNWDFTSLVIVSSKTTPITAHSNKIVTIRIINRNREVLLDTEYRFQARTIRAKVIWQDFEEFHIYLFEIGNESKQSVQNNLPLENRSSLLLETTFHFDRNTNKFKEKEGSKYPPAEPVITVPQLLPL